MKQFSKQNQINYNTQKQFFKIYRFFNTYGPSIPFFPSIDKIHNTLTLVDNKPVQKNYFQNIKQNKKIWLFTNFYINFFIDKNAVYNKYYNSIHSINFTFKSIHTQSSIWWNFKHIFKLEKQIQYNQKIYFMQSIFWYRLFKQKQISFKTKNKIKTIKIPKIKTNLKSFWNRKKRQLKQAIAKSKSKHFYNKRNQKIFIKLKNSKNRKKLRFKLRKQQKIVFKAQFLTISKKNRKYIIFKKKL